MIRCLQAWRAMVFCLLTQFKAKQNSIEEAFQKCKTKQINIIKCNIRNSKNLTKAEDIKKRCQENTEELYKKGLNDPDDNNGVVAYLKPDILEREVKWAFGSITMNKASKGDEIPVELFKILEDDAVKVLHSICQQIWKTQQWPQDWKSSTFIPIPKKGNAKECSNYHTAATAAKSLQSCPTLCDPIDGSPPGFPVPGILQARTLEWVAISFSNA